MARTFLTRIRTLVEHLLASFLPHANTMGFLMRVHVPANFQLALVSLRAFQCSYGRGERKSDMQSLRPTAVLIPHDVTPSGDGRIWEYCEHMLPDLIAH